LIKKWFRFKLCCKRQNGTTGVNESRVLATDLMHVSTELGNLGYNTGAYQGFTHNSDSNKELLNLIGIMWQS
jgi:hypothetical protein